MTKDDDKAIPQSSESMAPNEGWPEILEWAGLKIPGESLSSHPSYSHNQPLTAQLLLTARLEYNHDLEKPDTSQPSDVMINLYNGPESNSNPPVFGFRVSSHENGESEILISYGPKNRIVEMTMGIIDGKSADIRIDESERPSRANNFTTPPVYPATMYRVETLEGDRYETVTITDGALIKVFEKLGLPTTFRGGNFAIEPDFDKTEPTIKPFSELFKDVEKLVLGIIHAQPEPCRLSLQNLLPEITKI